MRTPHPSGAGSLLSLGVRIKTKAMTTRDWVLLVVLVVLLAVRLAA